MSSLARQKGAKGEALAALYLEQKGYRILTRNYTCQAGEIDLVSEKEGVLVFVEVKYYSDRSYMDALDSVTPAKIKKVFRACDHYLWTQAVPEDTEVRFDIVAIDETGGDFPHIKHIPDAFERDD